MEVRTFNSIKFLIKDILDPVFFASINKFKKNFIEGNFGLLKFKKNV
jgi:hypothetical protein